MAYYVPLGSRGILLRLGTSALSLIGGLIYWWGSRRRLLSPAPLVLGSLLPEFDAPPAAEAGAGS